MKCVFLDGASLAPEDLNLERLSTSCDEFVFYDETSESEIFERVSSAEIIISNKINIDAPVMDASPNLKYIAIAATGTNNVDLDAARQRNIAVTNVRGYGSNTVAQHTITLVLALSTNLLNYVDDVQSGVWSKSNFFCLLHHPIQDLAGKHLVIVGSGEIGRAVAKIAAGFDMQVSFSASMDVTNTSSDERLPLSELLPTADIVSLHCPLTPQTQDLIDAHAFSTMKPSALLINTARGGLVNEPALMHALKTKQIAGAGFDVLTAEPPVDGNPLLDEKLPNLIITPHCAWGSREARQRLVDDIVLSIDAFHKGEQRNRLI